MNPRIWSPLAALALGLGLLSSSAPQEPGERPRSTSTGELFLANCASCHGEKGDGQGVTDLDRKARSFKEGGFSYGNTPKTVERTITTGIPGTPMPAFGEALAEKQIADLAMYVIELGPGLPPPPKNTEMVVRDRPVVVRGILPPITEGAPTHLRGLVIGWPNGFSFEYRTDDVRLLGVRQGRFVDRTDWVGRGGTGLKPLGKVVGLQNGGNPEAPFSWNRGPEELPLRGRFLGTQVWKDSVNSGVKVRYELTSASGAALALVEEYVHSEAVQLGTGLLRHWILEGKVDDVELLANELRPHESMSMRRTARGYEVRSRELSDSGVELSIWMQLSRSDVGQPVVRSGEHWRFLLSAGEVTSFKIFKVLISKRDLEAFDPDEIDHALVQGLTR